MLTLTHSQSSSNVKTGFESSNVMTTHDSSPPTSVPYAYLDEVKLIFRVSAIPYLRVAPATKRRRLGFTTHYEPDSDMLFDIHSSTKNPEWMDHSQQMLDSPLQPESWLPRLPTNMLDLGRQSGAISQDGTLPIDCSQSVFGSKLGIVATPSATRSSPDNPTQMADTMLTDLASLIDVGLRSMICDNMVHKSPNIKLLSNSGRPKLAEISPALFSPGYMQVSDFYSQSQEFTARRPTLTLNHRHYPSETPFYLPYPAQYH